MKDAISETLYAPEQGSGRAFGGQLLVSVGDISSIRPVSVRVGAVGYANKCSDLDVGEFILFERNSEEIYEVRLMQKDTRNSPDRAIFLVSLIHPSHIVGNMSRLNERILWSSTNTTGEKFSQPEAEFIKAKLLIFEKQVNDTFSATKEQTDFIHKKVDYLVQALHEQSKTDWFYMSMGVFTSIAMSLGVSAANDDKFWQLIKNVLGIPVQILLGN